MNSAASAQQMHGGRTQASAQRARKGKLKLFGGSIARKARRNAGLPPLMGCTYATKRILATLTLTLTTSSSPSTYARDTQVQVLRTGPQYSPPARTTLERRSLRRGRGTSRSRSSSGVRMGGLGL